MRTTFKIEFVDGYPMIVDGENTIVIDTCCPVTFHEDDTLTFLGTDYTPAKSFRDETLRRLWDYTDQMFTTWMGMDVLKNYKLVLDYANNEITFLSQDEPGFEGETAKLYDGDGVYAVKADGWMNMLVDTRSRLSYLSRCFTMSLKTDGQQEEFYHGAGRFETPLYNLKCDFCGRKFDVTYGNLPQILDMTLMMAHVDGVLGYDFFKRFKVMLDFKSEEITFVDNEAQEQ